MAGQLLKRLDVINRNLFLVERAIEQDLKTREWVDEPLKEVAMRCMQKVPVLDKRGNPTGVWKFDSGGANTALQLMGKDRGMFVEKLQINPDDVEPDEDMEKMIEKVFLDIGRHNCFRIMGEVFNVKIEFESKLLLGRSKTDETSTEPTPEPESTVH